MISFAAGLIASLLFMQGALNAPRQALQECLKRASLTAAAQNLGSDQYKTYAAQQCATAANGFKNALISFDVKNGIKRATAANDAQLQVDDYVAMSAERYEDKMGVTPKATPAPVPAQAPQQPQN